MALKNFRHEVRVFMSAAGDYSVGVTLLSPPLAHQERGSAPLQVEMAMHRYTAHQFSKAAARHRRSKWVAAVSFLLALGVLSIYVLQNLGFLR